MELKVKCEMESMDCVVTFGKRPELILTPKLTTMFVTVESKLTTLRNWNTKQTSGQNGFDDGVSNRRYLAKVIRETLRDMAGFAQSMEEEGQIGMSDLFRYPKYSTYESLMAAAEDFADRAEPLAADFTERGLAATFVADLRAKITAFRGATENKHGGKADRRSGTAGMAATSAAGMKAVRALRPLMRVHLKDNPALLSAWNQAARVQRRHKPEEEVAAAPAPAPAPAS